MSNIQDFVESLKKSNNNGSIIFTDGRDEKLFVGHPFYIDYKEAYILISDYWKNNVNGIPQGTFLLAFYKNEAEVNEALLLRALGPVNLPTHTDVISSMIEYYKDGKENGGELNKLDVFTRNEFSFSGLRCRILGTFYTNRDGTTEFGADVENFFSAHNYKVYKATDDVLEYIANLRDGKSENKNDVKIGVVRYSSSRRHAAGEKTAEVKISPVDFLGKRTALFGMTRTGKSNTVKKIIEATIGLSTQAQEENLGDEVITEPDQMSPIVANGNIPRYPVGQIIFDVNGEYANANLQDEGTAIFTKFGNETTRYSVIKKEGFQVMKTNFYKEIQDGFGLICSHLQNDNPSDYINTFMAIDIEEPDPSDINKHIRWERVVAAYQCCLYEAGFALPKGFTVKFKGKQEIDEAISQDRNYGPGFALGKQTDAVPLMKASNWFKWIAENHQTHQVFINYRAKNGHDWADENLKAVLALLACKRNLNSQSGNTTGYHKLKPLKDYHTNVDQAPFLSNILELLSKGNIVIVDLSQGAYEIQQTFSKKICERIFRNAMTRFTESKPNNFIQFYFEEAHNLFPKKDDKDLTQIYNRLAKEGAKLNIGLIYATQEVSSISSNILKNTQNWFIAHLNNEDELKEIRKFYDFCDFTDALTRFSAGTDKGFVRMKTYSNPFVVPVQIDKFTAPSDN